MKRLLLAVALAPLAACSAELGSGPADDADDASQIDDYIRRLPFLPADGPSVVEGESSSPETQGDYRCTSENLSETRQYDKIVAYAANSDSLWPGAIVRGDSVYSGLFTQIVKPRAPETFSVSLENLAGTKSATLDAPSLSSYRDSLTDILDAEITGATPANIYSEIEQVHSETQLALALGAQVSWLGGQASIAASFDWSKQDVHSRYVVRYTQAYYTVDLDAPESPSAMFGDGVTLDDLTGDMNETSPPLYVSSVTYGRMVVFTFESQYSSEELAAALNFAYSGGVDVSGNVSVTYKDIISTSKITAFILGGSGGMAAQTIDSYEALINFIKTGGDYSRQSPGAPIAYKLSYLRDNSPGRFSFTTDYTMQTCERVSQRVKVTLKQIRVEDDGGDSGDLELYGSIWAESQQGGETMFSRDSDNYVQIDNGAAWPSGSFISEAIIPVSPQPGQSLQLGAYLVDYDTISNDDLIGDEVAYAPYELGWRRDVNVLLTGDDARVIVTFGLEPI